MTERLTLSEVEQIAKYEALNKMADKGFDKAKWTPFCTSSQIIRAGEFPVFEANIELKRKTNEFYKFNLKLDGLSGEVIGISELESKIGKIGYKTNVAIGIFLGVLGLAISLAIGASAISQYNQITEQINYTPKEGIAYPSIRINLMIIGLIFNAVSILISSFLRKSPLTAGIFITIVGFFSIALLSSFLESGTYTMSFTIFEDAYKLLGLLFIVLGIVSLATRKKSIR